MLSLLKHFDEVEWYDNHRIETIQACQRKGFWHLVGPPLITGPATDPSFSARGLANPVGPGADIGTCFHAAHAAYSYSWQRASEEERRIEALGVFESEWHRLFPNGAEASYHKLERGLQICDAYFERFYHEQALYRCIDPEVAFAIRVEPRDSEPSFRPFWFGGRLDGIDQRITAGDWVVRELKTTSGGAARRLRSLARSRQCKGYVWAAREALAAEGRDPRLVTGFVGDVILVAAKSTDFQRDYFPVTMEETESWRRQTINIVEEWRWRLATYQGRGGEGRGGVFAAWPALFPENTEECHKYGMCPYWDLCQFGPSLANLQPFELDSWSPAGDRKTKELILA